MVSTSQLSESQVVTEAVACLQAGGLVIFPTETTYGAGVDATNPEAVAKLLAYKARREGKPLSIAVTSEAMAAEYVELNDSARRLYARFLPGPVTVVSKTKDKVAPGVASEFGTVGVRIPAYDLVLKVVAALGRPITATSANASDAKRPYSITDIFDHLSAKQKSLIDLVIDAGQLPPNPPSTVIDTTHDTPVTFRQGEVRAAEATAVSGSWELSSGSESETKAIAGKLLLKHWNHVRERGLVIGLSGSLGVGKTIFSKGVAEFLQIPDEITSPTYTYIEEYRYQRHQTAGTFYHLDVWKVESAEVADRLEIPSLINAGSVVVIEWWDQVKNWLTLPNQTTFIEVTITDTPAKNDQRKLQIAENVL